MSYSFLANIISLIISVMMILIVPKILGVNEYGYWQLYLFYSGYIVYINFGWCDGIYLKYGGQDFKSIDNTVLGTQFFILALHEIIVSSVIYLFAFILIDDADKEFIVLMSCITGVIFVLRITLLYILQATNQIKIYASITIIDRIAFCLLVFLLLIYGENEYQILIAADLIAKSVTLVIAIWYCRRVVFARKLPFIKALSETVDVIRGGIKLITASLASLLIIGIIRFAIEEKWGTVIFGEISLTLSISNMFTIFISALSVVLFPTLRRISTDKLAGIYSILRNVIMIPLFGLLIAYLPFKVILSMWIPEYSNSIKYVALLLPIFLYETKMNILVNTYLKTLREEKIILITNLITVVLSIVTTLITVYYLKNLDLTVMLVLILLVFRSIFSELLLTKIININVKLDICLELAMTVTFVLTSWLIDSIFATIIYVIAYILYLFIKKTNIKNSYSDIKKLFIEGKDRDTGNEIKLI